MLLIAEEDVTMKTVSSTAPKLVQFRAVCQEQVANVYWI